MREIGAHQTTDYLRKLTMNKVIVFKSHLLPKSETFIRSQILSLKNWQYTLVGLQKINNGLDISDLNIMLLAGHTRLITRCFRLIESLHHKPNKNDVNLLKSLNADLIHVHFATEAVKYFPLFSSLNIPILITLHGFDIRTYKTWWEQGKGGALMRNYPRNLLALASTSNVHFIAVSESIKRSAVEYGIPEEKVTVNYIGVDTEQFAPSPNPIQNRKDILFIGRLVEKKGCIYLLKAFKELQESFPDSKLIVVGSGPLEHDLIRYSQENHIRAEFVGPQTPEQILAFLATARIFCLPSITADNGDAEGLPISILEAQACGVPVVTSAKGGNGEGIRDGSSGYSFDEKDVKTLTKLLAELLLDDKLVKKFSKNARDHITEKMDIRNCSRELEKIYSLHKNRS